MRVDKGNGSDLLIEVRNLSHTYYAGSPLAQRSLTDVSFTLAPNENAALIGSTGSGKSSLLQHLNGLILPQSGTVRVLGVDLGDSKTDLQALRRRVGLMFQRPENQIFETYVGDDVAYGPRTAGLQGKQLTRRVRWALEQVGLSFAEFKDRPVFTLSGGEKRKTGIAGVLALRPQLLLLDEPTSGLDPAARNELISRLAALRREGMRLVIATHDMDLAVSLAERLYVMHDGHVVMSGTPRQVFAEPERLRQWGLRAPAPSRLTAILRKQGLSLERTALTAEEAESSILSLFEGVRS